LDAGDEEVYGQGHFVMMMSRMAKALAICDVAVWL
jgi:hypothetical protein